VRKSEDDHQERAGRNSRPLGGRAGTRDRETPHPLKKVTKIKGGRLWLSGLAQNNAGCGRKKGNQDRTGVWQKGGGAAGRRFAKREKYEQGSGKRFPTRHARRIRGSFTRQREETRGVNKRSARKGGINKTRERRFGETATGRLHQGKKKSKTFSLEKSESFSISV